MSPHANRKPTPEEYLAQEREASHKSEFLNGEIFAMAGASPRHVLIVTNVVRELSTALAGGPCLVFSTDLRLQVPATGLYTYAYTYPDVMVACEELQFADEQRDTLLNPCLLIEVLSKSTGDDDRGQKFAHYRSLPSVVDYLLISQNRPHVELYTRQPADRWLFSETDGVEAEIELQSIRCGLQLREIYSKIDLLPVTGEEGSGSFRSTTQV